MQEKLALQGKPLFQVTFIQHTKTFVLYTNEDFSKKIAMIIMSSSGFERYSKLRYLDYK